MPDKVIEKSISQDYKYGFETAVEQDTLPPGLDEEVIRRISEIKQEPEWLLEWRLKAYHHWLNMKEPNWAKVHYPSIDYKSISYYSAPRKKSANSLDEVDPEILETYKKLGIPLDEQKMMEGVAVDAVFDSVSVATTFKETLYKAGVLFCSFSEAVKEYPDLIKQYLGSVVPPTDNFYAALNSATVSRNQILLVANQFGQGLGIVTAEDILETIAGRAIADENDEHASPRDFALQQKNLSNEASIETDDDSGD